VLLGRLDDPIGMLQCNDTGRGRKRTFEEKEDASKQKVHSKDSLVQTEMLSQSAGAEHQRAGSFDWAQQEQFSQLYAPARIFPSVSIQGKQLDIPCCMERISTAQAVPSDRNPNMPGLAETTWPQNQPFSPIVGQQLLPPSVTVPLASEQQLPAASNILWMREQMYTLPPNTQQQSPRQQLMLDTTIRAARPFDILLGRGKAHRKHLGNVRMQFVADMYRETYLNASDRESKSDISTAIVQMLKACTGRFLQFDKGLQAWIQVTDEAARKKIGHAIRDGRSRQLERIDPSVLQDLFPLIPDHIRIAALHRVAAETSDHVSNAAHRFVAGRAR
jgi:hypothetical protein